MDINAKALKLVESSNYLQLENFKNILALCESPIEQILLAALFVRWRAYVNIQLNRIECLFAADFPTYNGIFKACCEPQRIISTWNTKYRVDLYIYLTRFGSIGATFENNLSPELVKLAVEVDGHEFHEKTKEQASQDRERDRQIMLTGCPIIRFTGSDVFNNSESCAEKIDELLDEYAMVFFNKCLEQGKLEELIIGKN